MGQTISVFKPTNLPYKLFNCDSSPQLTFQDYCTSYHYVPEKVYHFQFLFSIKVSSHIFYS